MKDFEFIFNDIQRFESDIYIGDYSEYAKTHPTFPIKGVMLSNMPLSKIESTYLHLQDTHNLFKSGEYGLSWVISFPGYDNLIPFFSFLSNPDILLEYKYKYGVNIITDNHITILSHEFVIAGRV